MEKKTSSPRKHSGCCLLRMWNTGCCSMCRKSVAGWQNFLCHFPQARWSNQGIWVWSEGNHLYGRRRGRRSVMEIIVICPNIYSVWHPATIGGCSLERFGYIRLNNVRMIIIYWITWWDCQCNAGVQLTGYDPRWIGNPGITDGAARWCVGVWNMQLIHIGGWIATTFNDDFVKKPVIRGCDIIYGKWQLYIVQAGDLIVVGRAQYWQNESWLNTRK